MKIGQIIKEERTHRELTQEDMANGIFRNSSANL